MANTQLQSEFDAFWSSVWRKTAKGAALKAFGRARKKAPLDAILQGAKNFTKWLKAENTVPQFWPHPATWLNQERWTDDLEIKTPATPIWGTSGLNVEKQRDDWAIEQERSANALSWLESKPVDQVELAFDRIKRLKGMGHSNLTRSLSWRLFPALVAREMGWDPTRLFA